MPPKTDNDPSPALTRPTPAPARAAYAARHDISKQLSRILSLEDFEPAARKHLPRPLFGYIAGAAEDSLSLQANRDSFRQHSFRSRVMVDVSQRDLRTAIFGRTYSTPFGIAPIGISALSAYRGDIVLAAVAAAEEIPAIMSGTSLIPMETVHKAAPGTWFQAYLPGDTPVISATTGLIGIPEQTQQGIQMRVLLNPFLKIGQAVKLDNASAINQLRLGLDVGSQASNPQLASSIKTNADGLYYVMVANHSGDTRGANWYTDLTCLAIDASVPLSYGQNTNPFVVGPVPVQRY